MSPWRCVLCGEQVDAGDIMTGDHLRLFHPDHDAQPELWPDGEVVALGIQPRGRDDELQKHPEIFVLVYYG